MERQMDRKAAQKSLAELTKKFDEQTKVFNELISKLNFDLNAAQNAGCTGGPV